MKNRCLSNNTLINIPSYFQQHGSVYWRSGIKSILGSLKPEKFLHDQLAHTFSLLDSPLWMDSSTADQCRTLEQAVGGPLALVIQFN